MNKATIRNDHDTVVIALDNLTATLTLNYDVTLKKLTAVYQVEGHQTEVKHKATARDIWNFLNDMGV